MQELLRASVLAGLMVFCSQLAIAKTDGRACPPQESSNIEDDIEKTIGFPKEHFDLPHDEGPLARVCSERLCLKHSPRTKGPVWVIAKLNRSVVCGDNPRPHKWKRETRIAPFDDGSGTPKDVPVAKNSDYTGSGFARGHQAASAEIQSKLEHMQDTFYFSNAVPQIQDGFNGSYWRFLEDHIQTLAMKGKDMLVITGPVPMRADGKPSIIKKRQNACKKEIRLPGISKLKKRSVCKENKGTSTAQCESGVAVPAGMFKIIYTPDSDRVFAFLMSNRDHREIDDDWPDNDDYLEQWRVSVDVIEKLTNLEFFPRNTRRRNKIKKQGCIATPWH